MSLLDDVSIVVTPNGYKAGELYAVVPVPTEGAEEITDGTFPSGTSVWSEGTGWSLVDGYANASSASGELSQSGLDFDTSKRYYIQYTISGYLGSGGVKARFKGYVWNTGVLREENGTFTEVLMSTAENTVFTFVTSSSFTGSISNVSVKEWTASDMDVTRATDATRVDENGLIEDVLSNVPRIDYTGGGCPHILVEPERTNLIEYSEDFTDSSWVKTNVDVSNNTELAPNGTETATRAIISSTGTDLRTQCNVIESTNYTFTFYAKKGTSTDITYRVYDVSNGSNIVSPTNYFSQVGIDWQRVELNFTTPSGCTSVLLYLSSDSAVVGDIYLWGVQLEKSYATSYIPNFGTAAGVTRNQDIFTRNGIGSLINSTEGVLFIEMAALSNDLTNRSITISDGSTNNIIQILFSSVSNTIRFIIRVGGVGGDNLDKSTSSYTVTDFNKVALKWEQNNAQVWINGTQLGLPDTNSDVPTGLNDLSFKYLTIGNNFYGKVKQLQIFKTALSDSELATLTTS